MLIEELVVWRLVFVFHFLNYFQVVAITLLPFLIVTYGVSLDGFIVLLDLICSVLAAHVGLHSNTKLAFGLLSIVMSIHVFLIAHIASLAIFLNKLGV